MSRNAWIGLGIVVAVVIIGGVVYAMSNPASAPGTAPYGSESGTGSYAEPTSTLPSGTSTSDASLNTDLKSVDSQMSGFNSDNAAASQSVSQESSSAQ